jgi:N,N'-diacetyllegionaminate synthase
MPNSIYIIAEIASAHEGDPEFAHRLLAAAAQTGADAVKFQIFCRDELMSKRHPKFESFGEIEIPPDAWKELLSSAHNMEIGVVAEVFDERSLDLAVASNCVDSYKIPTSDINNRELIQSVCRTGKRLCIGVGGATEDEIDRAVELLRADSADFVLMHGFQSYPTLLGDTNLARIRALWNRYGMDVGYADHVDAEDSEMSNLVPLLAISAGAVVIEKHITDDRSRKGRDYFSALTPDEFTRFVEHIRCIECVMGTPAPELSPAELRYREDMKRYAVAAKNIDEGDVLNEASVAYKRIGDAGMTQTELKTIIGRSLMSSKSVDDPLMSGDFSE